MSTQKIILVDGSRLMRTLLRKVISNSPGLEIVTEVDDVGKLPERAQQIEADWMIISCPEDDELPEKVERLIQQSSPIRFLIMDADGSHVRMRWNEPHEVILDQKNLKEILHILRKKGKSDNLPERKTCMDNFTRDTMNELAAQSGQDLISIYLPTHRSGRAMQQDPIRLRNLLSKAEEQLENRGWRRPEIEAQLRPAHELQLGTQFWQRQSDGLAMFIAPGAFEFFRLPVKFDELLVVGERFHLKSLFPLLSNNGHFYILALSQNQVRLLHGSKFSVYEVDLEGLPTNIAEALRFDQAEQQVQFHTGTTAPGATGRRPSIFHGHGGSRNTAKDELLRFFQQVDDGLMQILRNEQAPLLLAGVDYLLPIYRHANHYTHLAEPVIEGNPDQLSMETLHQRAWELIEPRFKSAQDEAIRRYRQLSHTNSRLASANLATILAAAHHGRVETLFVSLGTQLWGVFDSQTNLVQQHAQFQPGDQDLLDLAALATLRNAGIVYALAVDEMPENVLLAAIFRYTYMN